MSTDHTSGMPPLDALSFDAGAYVSESASASQSVFMGDDSVTGSEAGYFADATREFSNDRLVTGAIEFRVIRSGSPVRRLRLTGNRYTFGSAEGCSIQLNDPTLRPMHAVLIRDAHRILVRAYSVPIELNDSRTTEASLQAGDVIRLGAYSFELLSTSTATSHQTTKPSYAFNAPTQADPTAWREQLRREVAQWRARQAECDRREGRCSDRETVLRSRESELWSRAEQLHRRESHLMAQESAALQIQEDYAAKQQEIVLLRDESRAKQQAFQARETEFRSLEQEYREHVEEASRQLQQSQQQAEAATQAVQRMREQFADLNSQLEELQNQQSDLQQKEAQQTSEHQRLRLALEASRDAAVDGRAQEIVRRQEIEKRISELDSQLVEAQAECQAERRRADESEEVAQKLREQIKQLHENIGQADDEAARLRQDYEQACESVRCLEAVIEQGNTRGEMDRESWYGEAEELRQSVEQLSIDIARANSEIGDLRKANQELSDRLSGLTHERDEALNEVESRPTQDAFESLREELGRANDKLAEMQREYEETIERLEAAQNDRVSHCHDESENESGPSVLGVAGAFAASSVSWAASDLEQVDEEEDVVSESNEFAVSDDPQNAFVDDHHSAWPSYSSDESSESATEESVDVEDESHEETTLHVTHPEKQGFRSPLLGYNDLSDDAPQWSAESMQKTDAPHFDTEEPEAWDSSDSDPENYAAEFDRSETTGSNNNQYKNANESVDKAIDLIERNVDEAMAVEVTSPVAETTDEDAQSVQTSAWGYETADDDSQNDEPQNETDVISPWNSTSSVADEVDASASMWQVESDDDEPDRGEPQNESDVASPWNADPSIADIEEPTSNADDALVSSWQPISSDDDESSNQDEDDQESLGLADQLIRDLGSSSQSSSSQNPEEEYSEDAATGEETYAWEKTQPFSGFEHDKESPSGFGWDQEFPEESRSSEWENDIEGGHTEVIHRSLIESVMETPFAEANEEDAANLLADSVDDYSTSPHKEETTQEDDEPAPIANASSSNVVEESQTQEEDDDSIEAYMNRLLNRVQGSPGTESAPVKSVPLVASTKVVADESSSTAANTSLFNKTTPLVDSDAPLVPRSQAPERNSDLSAMRELANQSARTAVAHSGRIQARDTQIKAMMKFGQAGIAGLCGLACFTFLDWSMTLKMIIVVAILIIVGILVQEGLVLLKEAKRRLRPTDSKDVETIEVQS